VHLNISFRLLHSKGKGKVHPTVRHERTEGEYTHSCFLDFNLGTRWGYGINATPRPLYPWERDPVLIATEAGWALGSDWTGAENLAPPAFVSRTVHPGASFWTDWAIPAHSPMSVESESEQDTQCTYKLNTGLFEMIVGVLTTCHTQYTWDRSICIFFI
jgi:hypothetical protein